MTRSPRPSSRIEIERLVVRCWAPVDALDVNPPWRAGPRTVSTPQNRRTWMSSLEDTAARFYDACETGRGWEACAPFCHADASFAA